jgi:hypothetical protein
MSVKAGQAQVKVGSSRAGVKHLSNTPTTLPRRVLTLSGRYQTNVCGQAAGVRAKGHRIWPNMERHDRGAHATAPSAKPLLELVRRGLVATGGGVPTHQVAEHAVG